MRSQNRAGLWRRLGPAMDEEIAEDAEKRDLWFALLAEEQQATDEEAGEAAVSESVGSAGG